MEIKKMINKKEQIIRLCHEDKELINKLIKWVKFFSIMYLILWIIMCITLFTTLWLIFGNK